MPQEQLVHLVVGDHRAPELPLGAHRGALSLPAHSPQQEEVGPAQPARQLFVDRGHGAKLDAGGCRGAEGPAPPGPRAMPGSAASSDGVLGVACAVSVNLALRVGGVDHAPTQLLHHVRMVHSHSAHGGVAGGGFGRALGCGLLVRALRTRAHRRALGELARRRAATRPSGVATFVAALHRAVQRHPLHRPRRDLLGIAEILAPTAAPAVAMVGVVLLVGEERLVLGPARIEVLAHDDAAIEGHGAGAQGLQGAGGQLAAVGVAAARNADAIELPRLEAAGEAVGDAATKGAGAGSVAGHGSSEADARLSRWKAGAGGEVGDRVHRAVQIGQQQVFVGAMGQVDAAGPKDQGFAAQGREVAAIGGKGRAGGARIRGPGKQQGQVGAASIGQQRRAAGQQLQANRPPLGLGRGVKRRHVVREQRADLSHRLAGQRSHAHADLAVVGDDVHRGAAPQDGRIEHRPGAGKVAFEAAIRGKGLLQFLQGQQHPGGQLDGAQAQAGPAGVGRAPKAANAPRGVAGVQAADAKIGGLADHRGKGQGIGVGLGQLSRQRGRPAAAHLLVAGPEQHQLARQGLALDAVAGLQGGGDEALHVAGAPPVQPVAALAELEGVTAPVLAFNGHDIHMARQDEPLAAVAGSRPPPAQDIDLARVHGEAFDGKAGVLRPLCEAGRHLQHGLVADRGPGDESVQGLDGALTGAGSAHPAAPSSSSSSSSRPSHQAP